MMMMMMLISILLLALLNLRPGGVSLVSSAAAAATATATTATAPTSDADPLTAPSSSSSSSVPFIKKMRFQVPETARLGNTIKLSCIYELSGASLHAMKLFKDEKEFYRYTPAVQQQRQQHQSSPHLASEEQRIAFASAGIKVDLVRSNDQDIWIKILDKRAAGAYKCQVSIEDTFKSISVETRMQVIERARTSGSAATSWLNSATSASASSASSSSSAPHQQQRHAVQQQQRNRAQASFMQPAPPSSGAAPNAGLLLSSKDSSAVGKMSAALVCTILIIVLISQRQQQQLQIQLQKQETHPAGAVRTNETTHAKTTLGGITGRCRPEIHQPRQFLFAAHNSSKPR